MVPSSALILMLAELNCRSKRRIKDLLKAWHNLCTEPSRCTALMFELNPYGSNAAFGRCGIANLRNANFAKP